MSRERDRLSDEMDRLSELQARQDAALGEAWPDNPSPAYRRAREAWVGASSPSNPHRGSAPRPLVSEATIAAAARIVAENNRAAGDA